MSTDSDPESLLEAALDQAFSPPPLRKHAPGLSTSGAEKLGHEEVVEPQTHENPSAESTSTLDSSAAWKAEYEEHVRAWHAESADARSRAEKERARWEAIRAAAKEEASQSKTEPWESEWERVATRKDQNSETTPNIPEYNVEHELHTQADTTDESHKLEEIHSMTSSFPSMTFPERTSTPSPSPSRYHTNEPPRTATLAIFDSSLSARTRMKALFASLAINMLLPFVNGVMLGFGEIFAKEVIIGWFGWKKLGSIAASAGLRTPQRQRFAK
ncbi:hypothetical protein APHAL10511_007357 [Amanita phalloides]|nr:hypothetical protein APHAL10511_007357 [Amanita phalloides]